MTNVIFRGADGLDHQVEAMPGATLMETAVNAGIEYIVGECSGACACATCHTWIDPAWWGIVGPPDEFEADMLEALDTRAAYSRLSCQIKVTAGLHGLVVHEPVATA